MTSHVPPSSLPMIPIAAAPEQMLRRVFSVAVDACDPLRRMPEHLGSRPAEQVIVIGGGLAATRMAETLEQQWGPCEGLVITGHGHARACRGVEIVETDDLDQTAAGATARMVALLANAAPQAAVVALISGGTETRICSPRPPLDLTDLRAIWATARAAGASAVHRMKLLQSLNAQLAGQLTAGLPSGQLRSIVISDMSGNDPALIGGGPTVPAREMASDIVQDARAGLARLGIVPPAMIQQAMAHHAPAAHMPEAAIPQIIATPTHALQAVTYQAEAEGLRVEILETASDGEASEIAATHARMAMGRQAVMAPGDTPRLLLSTGASSVESGDPRRIGAPNADYVLAAAQHLQETPGIYVMAANTSGFDGPSDAAGAIATPDLLRQIAHAGHNPARILAAQQSAALFDALGQTIAGESTGTAVGDLRAFLLLPPDAA